MRSDENTPFGKFLKEWREALSVPSDLWEGYKAVEDLKRAGYSEGNVRTSMFTFVRCEPSEGWRPREMLRNVFAEVLDYMKQRLAWKKEFRDIQYFLAKLERKAVLKSGKISRPSLKRLVSNTAEMIERRRKALATYMSGSLPRSPLGRWETLWTQHGRAEQIDREIELDTRLQLQCAKMFRTFLHEDEGVLLRTIARLVVLVYKAAALASESKNEGFLRISDSGRAIRVRSVEEKLRRQGNFKSEGP